MACPLIYRGFIGGDTGSEIRYLWALYANTPRAECHGTAGAAGSVIQTYWKDDGDVAWAVIP